VSVARIPARIVCPGCGKIVAAVPIDGDGYRMRAHNRPLDADRYVC
jgi:hypothetical protein